MKDSCEKNRTDIDEESFTVDMLALASNFDLNAKILGYLRYAGHTERLHRHHVKMKSSSLPASSAKKFD